MARLPRDRIARLLASLGLALAAGAYAQTDTGVQEPAAGTGGRVAETAGTTDTPEPAEAPETAETPETVETLETAETPEPAEREEKGWLDAGYEGIDTRAQNLANWMDEFFGHARDVQDAPESLVRVRPSYQWDEVEDEEWRIRVTGKLYLPKTNDRLSVVFLGDERRADDDFYDPALASTGSGAAGAQYQVRDRERSSAHLFVGVKTGLKAKLGGRYQYRRPFMGVNRMRFSEEVFWVGGDGFGSLTRVEFDHLLSEQVLLRWANKAEIREDSEGWEWTTRLAWVRKLSDREALRLFGYVSGESDPRILYARGFGLGFRRRFLRDWLFLEIEPRYEWRKYLGEPDRQGVAMFKVQLEAVIGDL